MALSKSFYNKNGDVMVLAISDERGAANFLNKLIVLNNYIVYPSS